MATTVVKCGGAVEPAGMCADVAALRAAGDRVAVVHGGAGDIAALSEQMRVPNRTLRSPDGLVSRYTEPAMLDVVVLAMTGRAKPRLLAALSAAGVRAAGVTGLDGGLLRAVRKPARRAVEDGRTRIVRDDQSGRIVSVDPTLLRVMLAAGITPVVSPPAADADGAALNVDADRVAAAVAAALDADRLVLLTAAPGVLAEATDPDSLLDHCALPDDGVLPHAASDGMYRKLVAAREALRGGVPEVYVADGRVTEPVSAALRGAGTSVTLCESVHSGEGA